jgi:methylated-DNA-protein-cysteine methyltransferase-like protein
MPGGPYERIYAVIRKIPKGRVATYGQIAHLADLPGHARQVGYALSALFKDQGVPWHRVVNAKGEISVRAEAHFENPQRDRLEAEGVVFNAQERISLARFLWKPNP